MSKLFKTIVINGQCLNLPQIKEMRNWCADCLTEEDDIDHVLNNASNEEVVSLIEKNFEGGLSSFLKTL
jgi:hypothetical protein